MPSSRSLKCVLMAMCLAAKHDIVESRLSTPQFDGLEPTTRPVSGPDLAHEQKHISKAARAQQRRTKRQRRMPGTRGTDPKNNRIASTLNTERRDEYEPEASQYIVGGSRTKTNRFPYFVSTYQIISGEKYQVCGATLIHEDIVLTAAHCAEHSPKVRVGAYTNLNDDTNGGIPFHDSDVEEVVSHPDFYYDTLQRIHYDFALLRLKDPVTDPYLLKSMMNLDQVVEVDQRINQGKMSSYVTAIGLGRLSEDGGFADSLNEVILRYMNNKSCENYFGNVPDIMMCAKGREKDACTGDSGGPLIVLGSSPEEDVQIGVTSWGSGCASAYPGAYARISLVADWIRETICEISSERPSYCTDASRIFGRSCIEEPYCKSASARLPTSLFCFMNGKQCEITCGKCASAVSINSSNSRPAS